MLGAHEECCRHADAGIALYDPERHRLHALLYGGHDAKVCALGERALSCWLLGRLDESLASVRLAQRVGGVAGACGQPRARDGLRAPGAPPAPGCGRGRAPGQRDGGLRGRAAPQRAPREGDALPGMGEARISAMSPAACARCATRSPGRRRPARPRTFRSTTRCSPRSAADAGRSHRGPRQSSACPPLLPGQRFAHLGGPPGTSPSSALAQPRKSIPLARCSLSRCSSAKATISVARRATSPASRRSRCTWSA